MGFNKETVPALDGRLHKLWCGATHLLHLPELLFSCFYVRQRTGTCCTQNTTSHLAPTIHHWSFHWICFSFCSMMTWFEPSLLSCHTVSWVRNILNSEECWGITCQGKINGIVSLGIKLFCDKRLLVLIRQEVVPSDGPKHRKLISACLKFQHCFCLYGDKRLMHHSF